MNTRRCGSYYAASVSCGLLSPQKNARAMRGGPGVKSAVRPPAAQTASESLEVADRVGRSKTQTHAPLTSTRWCWTLRDRVRQRCVNACRRSLVAAHFLAAMPPPQPEQAHDHDGGEARKAVGKHQKGIRHVTHGRHRCVWVSRPSYHVRRLAFGAASARAVTRSMARSRPSLPRCAGLLTRACKRSMRPYRTNGFSARPECSGGSEGACSGVD